MCGIVGIISPTCDPKLLESNLARAVLTLQHRGPDDHGIWVNGSGVGLGFRRLSILDLSDHGHQPMVSTNSRYTMVFNGEVYNFAEIRRTLAAKGHSFVGSGDSEVILAAFQEWGEDAVHRFIGMFAIALWDEQERTLILIRDRLGIKPLYYGWDGKTLVFGSELKALRAFDQHSPDIDMRSAGEFFQYGYISSGRTIFEKVRKLEPGHRLKIRRATRPIVERYWSVLDSIGVPLSGDDEAIAAELEALMVDAFRYRLVSDVPVGVFLSGGIDSSLVTAILARHAEQPISTYTIGFKETEHDESPWAGRVAAHLGTRHTEYILEMDEALRIARNWGDLFDEPFADPSGIPTLLVSRLASREVKVVLSADGGDELFSGYSIYPDVLGRVEKLSSIPDWMKSVSGSIVEHLPVGALNGAMSSLGIPAASRGFAVRRIRRLRAMFPGMSTGRLYDSAVSTWLPEEVQELLGEYNSPRTSADKFNGAPAEQMCLWDLHNYLPENILTKVDRTTMAVSIEGREPLLDHRVVEYAFRLPLHLRRGSLGSKH
ncbi:MAG: asparagine synthase (glutamine-hydrolyzing), partial [Candidatus Krumholzibacteriota bacterium]|nr:asparagine synthase (glutamine-hydrolyzing) [Candidatus Krumholzibacteriota bacterium]